MKKIVIAIDGYSSCGKSTFAKAIAKELGYIYIDSGAMYRAVTLFCLRLGLVREGSADRRRITGILHEIKIEFIYNSDKEEYETLLNTENVENDIRGMDVTANVSSVSQIPEVRERLVEIQRHIGSNKGIVMDGRDIGTVVFPNAELKIFMTASVEIRAKRRFDELYTKGIKVDLGTIRDNITARDITDENRDISPLKRADDAILLDNSRISINEQMEWVRRLIEQKLNDN